VILVVANNGTLFLELGSGVLDLLGPPAHDEFGLGRRRRFGLGLAVRLVADVPLLLTASREHQSGEDRQDGQMSKVTAREGTL